MLIQNFTLDQRKKINDFKKIYNRKLNQIYNYLLKNYSNFPILCCHESAYILSQLFDFKEIGGYFVLNEYNIEMPHIVAKDNHSNLYVDISISQFNRESILFDPISIFPVENNLLFFPNSRITNYHLERKWSNNKKRFEKIDGLVKKINFD